MSTMRSIAASLAAVALTSAAAAGGAGAQDTPAGVQPYRFTVAGHLTQMQYDRGGDASRAALGGYGVRVMFNRSDPAKTLRSLFDRASVGAFANFSTSQNNVESTQHFGVQGDVALLNAPTARGLLDPFVSLGIGALRENLERGDADFNVALTPAIGTRIPLFSGIGFRGDVRLPVVFGEDTRVHPSIEGGVYLSF